LVPARTTTSHLGVGRLTAAKDFETLIKAFALVRKKTEARLMILEKDLREPSLSNLLSSSAYKMTFVCLDL